MVDKNNYIHSKHHQISVCGVNNKGKSKGFSQAGQGRHPSFQYQWLSNISVVRVNEVKQPLLLSNQLLVLHVNILCKL